MHYRWILGASKLMVALLVTFILSACNNQDASSDTTVGAISNKSQVLQIRMHDLPISGEDVEKVIVDITGVEVHHAEMGWMSVPYEARQYDLLELQNGTSVIIFEQPLEIGQYTQIRLLINENNQLYIGGNPYPLKIPSGEQTGIKLNTPFEIKQGKIVEVTLDFDVKHSVKIVRDQGFLKPVIKVDSIAEYNGAGIITPAGGYVSSEHEDFNIIVPPNTTTGSVVFFMNEINPATLSNNLPENTTLVGRAYDLEPEGYPFPESVILEIPYNEDAISAIGNEEDLYVVTYNEETASWEPVTSTVVTSANIVRALVSHFSIYALALRMTNPVNTSWTARSTDNGYALMSDTAGLFFSKDGELQGAITSTKAATVTLGNTQFSHRPTLFISLCGFNPNNSDLAGNWGDECDWQSKLEAQLATASVNNDYQYKHFAVDWDTHASNKTQVDYLTDYVNNFLDMRIDSWDIVVIGHSRGGIFAHDLTRGLVGHGKLKNLHTFLLDPTASLIGDFYPTSKYETAAPKMHYGTLFYDNEYWTNDQNNVSSIGTHGDMDIIGYTNYGRHDHFFPDASHSEIPSKWISRTGTQSLTQALADIVSVKDSGTFEQDGTMGVEVVRVERAGTFAFNGDITYEDGNLRVWGEFTIASIPSVIDASFGKDGVQVGSSIGMFATEQIVINESQIVVSQGHFLDSYYISIGNGEINATLDLTLLKTDITVNSDEVTFELQIGGETISGSVDAIDLIFPGSSVVSEDPVNTIFCFSFC